MKSLPKILTLTLLLFNADPSLIHASEESPIDFSRIRSSGLLTEVPCESHSLLDLPADLYERLIQDEAFKKALDDYAPTLTGEALYQTFLEPENFMFEKSAQLLKEKQEREEEHRIQKLKEAKPERTKFIESSKTEVFKLAREIEEKYGVEIDYGRDALNYWWPYCEGTSNTDLSMILDDLRIIDEELSRYPSMIFYDQLKGLNIALVSDYKDMGAEDSPRFLQGSTINGRAQQKSESDTYPNQYAEWFISLRARQNDFRRNLHHELGHIIAWHCDPSYVDDIYPQFSKIYENLENAGSFNFLNQTGDRLRATHINSYQNHDVHEYLSVLYSYMLVDEEDSIFVQDSFLSQQARELKKVLFEKIPQLKKFEDLKRAGE